MRNAYSYFACLLLAGAAALLSGCSSTEPFLANPEPKFARGLANVLEPIRLGEFRRSMEQHALFSGADATYTAGLVDGVNRTLARTGLGVVEMVTAPFPPHHPMWTDYLAPGPVYPDNYKPDLM